MKIKRVSKPVGLAYPLNEVKTFLQVDSDHEDGMIGQLINSAVGLIYQHTWIDIQSTSFIGYLDNYATVTIPRWPVTEITSVKYYNTSSVLTTMTVNTDYELDLNGVFAKVRFINEPTLQDKEFNNIEIAFKSGCLTHYEIDDEIVTAFFMIIRDWYDNRGSVAIGANAKVLELPFAAKVILDNASRRTL